jgi:hypothetical protein
MKVLLRFMAGILGLVALSAGLFLLWANFGDGVLRGIAAPLGILYVGANFAYYAIAGRHFFGMYRPRRNSTHETEP